MISRITGRTSWEHYRSGFSGKRFRDLIAIMCAVILVPGSGGLINCSATQTAAPAAQEVTQSPVPPPAASSAQEDVKIPAEQLEMLVAPIALYPDPLLSQTLVASTYPLELVQLQQWLEKNKGLKDKALADAVSKQTWDASIQAMAALPDLVKRLSDDIQWTTDLGNAFLAQQGDVMDAVQRMRKKAQDKGTLKSTEQQKVETRVIESKNVIVVEQADPQVVYVPSYDPFYVWGAPIYPYPPIYYPAGYYAAGLAVSFGVGVMMGAFWSGGWGWGAGWGNNNININNNNNFNRNSNIGGGNRASQLPNRGGDRGGIGGGDRGNFGAGGRGDASWKHNPQHRGGAPYRDRATADRFGGAARGDSLANRQAGARQQLGRQGGNLASNRAGDGGVANRSGGGLGANNRLSGGGPNSIGGRDLTRGGAGNRDAFG